MLLTLLLLTLSLSDCAEANVVAAGRAVLLAALLHRDFSCSLAASVVFNFFFSNLQTLLAR